MAIISKEEIDFYSGTAVYAQMIAVVKQKIISGQYKPGDVVDTELQLCADLGVSRSTVRQAFAQLEKDGYIIRLRGKGTFISKPKLKRSLNTLYNFTNEMEELNLKPSSVIIEFSRIKAPQKIQEPLQISSHDTVFKIKRLRLADGEPIILETAYIPERFCPDLKEEDLSRSLYAAISQYNQSFPMEAQETYDAILLKEKDAVYLKCPPGSPAFQINRISKNTNGQLFEYAILIAPGKMNQYQITLRKNDISGFSHNVMTQN